MSDSLFTVHRFEIPIKHFNEDYYLCIFSDVHRFAHNCDVDRWKGYLNYCKKLQEETGKVYYLGLGDYDDLASTSEREAFYHAKLHDTTIKTLDDLMAKRTLEFIDEISFMKDRAVGLIEGNHYYQFDSGQTSTMKMCDSLRCKYLGGVSVIRLIFRYGKKHLVGVDIYAHHTAGKKAGGGRRIGSSLNALEDMTAVWDADVYLCLDKTTQILTLDGWKSIGEIKKGDPVFSYKDGSIYEDTATDVYQKPYKGEMIHIKNSNVDMLLTPNHRVIYRLKNCKTKKMGYWLKKDASEFVNYQCQAQIPLAGIVESEYHLSDDEIALTGWLIAEGHFRIYDKQRGQGIDINQKSHEKVAIIKSILDRLGYDYSSWVKCDGLTSFHIRKASARLVLRYVDKKNIPDWVFKLSKRQFDIFFKNLVLGDGYARYPTAGTYYSGDESLIDRLQWALAIHGYRTRKYFKKGGFKNGCWVIGYCQRSTTDIPFSRIRASKAHYSGDVWCIHTKNESLIARRNGYVFITGNSGHDHKFNAAMPSTMYLDSRMKVKQKERLLVRTGSFQKGWVPDTKGYVPTFSGRPNFLGAPIIRLRPVRERPDANHEYTYVKMSLLTGDFF